MKILVIGQPRSRSNYLASCLATHHGMRNRGEPYAPAYRSLAGEGGKRLGQFAASAEKITETLRETTIGFVCKIQTSNVVGHKLDVTDLKKLEHFGFDMYDQIYITMRKNIVDQLCSLSVAFRKNAFVYKYTDDTIPTNPGPGSFAFDPVTDIKRFNGTDLDMLKLRFIHSYIKNKELPVKIIYYEDSPQWVADNLPNARTEMLETHFNYKEIFSNYAEMEEMVRIYFGTNIASLPE